MSDDSTRDNHELSSGDDFGLSAVREVLRMISETDITEIQIERGTSKLHIKRGPIASNSQPFIVTPAMAAALSAAGSAPPQPVAPQYQSMPPVAQHAHTEQSESDLAPGSQMIISPMVGTFYRSPSPKDAAYVHEGDTVQVGEVVGIIEAMKIMNEIESEFAGRVARILVKSGQPVEYGQALMIIEPLP